VQVVRRVLDDLTGHASDAAPGECCGLLIGTPARVVAAARAANLAGHDTRYLIDPADHFAAIRRARAAGLQVVGAYHSHPATPARPSASDLQEALPDFLYFIVSLAPAGAAVGLGVTWGGAVVRGWQLDAGAGTSFGPDAAARVGSRSAVWPAPGNFVEVALLALLEENE
jgi:proteasome lid subunit RPN8/RPN11